MSVNRAYVWTFAVAAAAVVTLSSLAAQVGQAQLAGRPKFSEGNALGYFIWKDGDTWKVRWTTFGSNHHFTGRVEVEGGEFRSFKRVDVDTERKVIAPGHKPRVIRGARGRVRGVAPGKPAVVATKEEDHINQETERLLQFSTRTDDDIDGFDFKTTGDANLLRFRLQIDGRPQPAEIEVGRDNMKPNQDPLVVRLR
jgi:hypothetical protein